MHIRAGGLVFGSRSVVLACCLTPVAKGSRVFWLSVVGREFLSSTAPWKSQRLWLRLFIILFYFLFFFMSPRVVLHLRTYAQGRHNNPPPPDSMLFQQSCLMLRTCIIQSITRVMNRRQLLSSAGCSGATLNSCIYLKHGIFYRCHKSVRFTMNIHIFKGALHRFDTPEIRSSR